MAGPLKLLFCFVSSAIVASAIVVIATVAPSYADPLKGVGLEFAMFNTAPGVQTGQPAICPAGSVPLGGGGQVYYPSEVWLASSTPTVGNTGWDIDYNNYRTLTTPAELYAICANAPADYRIVSSGLVLAPPGVQSKAEATCPAGTVVLGGGVTSFSAYSVNISDSYPNGKTGWVGAMSNTSGVDTNIEAYATCGAKPEGYKIVSKSRNMPAHRGNEVEPNCGNPEKEEVIGGGVSSSSRSTQVNVETTAPLSFLGGPWDSLEANYSSSDASMTGYAICAHQPTSG